MANTEGMSDEFVQSLMMAPATSSSTSKKSSMSRRLQQRMELPIGKKPAAKVVRMGGSSSSSQKQATKVPSSRHPEKSMNVADSTSDVEDYESMPTSSPQHSNGETRTAPPIVGDVMEHDIYHDSRQRSNKNKNTRNAKRTSRFSQQQSGSVMNKTGFPSVHVPLGTFTRNKSPRVAPLQQHPQNPPAVGASKNTQHQKKHSQQSDLSPTTIPLSTAEESIADTAQRDAQNMVQGMTQLEIQTRQTELSQALSPEMIQFLKQRGISKKKVVEEHRQQEPKRDVGEAASTQSKSSQQGSSPPDKARLADMVSSVQSHQDLDAIYKQVMTSSHPLEQNNHPTDTDHPEGDDDFSLACDLLRSSSPRQVLWASRVVSKTLFSYVQNSGCCAERSWPTLLPVSLRCLLDQPMAKWSGVLHTYVLDSMYSLLLLLAHPSHVVLVGKHESSLPPTCSSIYQDCFLDDAVPTPSLEEAYTTLSTSPQSEQTVANGAAYATSSSSTSAESDADSFEKDPLWTVLSKFRMLPLLAKLLCGEMGQELPMEGWVAIAGILCMIAQRSPGAASAIVHHKGLVSRLTSCMLVRVIQQGDMFVDPGDGQSHSLLAGAAAVLVLLRTLARQSRIVAEAIPHLEDILPPAVGSMATTEDVFRLQKLALQLWRILLRYGLGLEAFTTMTRCAAQHVSLPAEAKFSLATEFVSCFAQVMELSNIVHDMDRLGKAADSVPVDSIQILSLAIGSLITTKQQILQGLSTGPISEVADSPSLIRLFSLHSAKLKFLNTLLAMSVDHGAQAMVNTSNTALKDLPSRCLTLVSRLIADEWCEHAIDLVFPTIENDSKINDRETIALEAASASFMHSFSSTMNALRTRCGDQDADVERFEAMANRFSAKLLATRKLLYKAARFRESGLTDARCGWLGLCYFSIARFMSHGAFDESANPSHTQTTRLLSLSLLGSFRRGNEALAAVLLSQKGLVTDNSSDHLSNDVANSNPGDSEIASVLFQELCGFNQSRKQLDHSFKLIHGRGLTISGLGSFALSSLLSEVDQPGMSSKNLVLPYGESWLWQTLSGGFGKSDGSIETTAAVSVSVLASSLSFILTLERDGNDATYAKTVPLGTKLYFLMNICLQPEVLLRENRIQELVLELLEFYLDNLSPPDIAYFCKTCHSHTGLGMKGGTKEQSLAASATDTASSSSSLEARSLDAFLDDMCDAFNEYGALYGFFSKFIRLFVSPFFSVAVQCRAVKGLQGVLHLLSLPEETVDSPVFRKVVSNLVLRGGLEAIGPDTADMAMSLLANENPSSRLSDYVVHYSIIILSKSLADKISTAKRAPIEICQHFLTRLTLNDQVTVVCVCLDFLAGERRNEAMIDAAIDHCRGRHLGLDCIETFEELTKRLIPHSQHQT